jgi:hypothetical protein
MPATKKTTAAKSTKSPAPATKAPRASAKKKAVTPEPVALAVAALSVAATPKAVASKSVATTIKACIDVGFGNALYVRGEGPGLSWDKGLLMQCVGQDQWQISLGESARPFLVKFLINDVTWSTGPDYTVPSGVSLTLAPQF